MRPFTVGIVGCGSIGLKRAKCLTDEFVLKYVYDSNVQRAEEASRALRYPVAVARTLDDVLRDTDVDIVVVATPHKHLAPIATHAASTGHHVLIEKPGGCALDEIAQLARIARQSKVRIHVGFNHRFHPSVLQAKQIIDSEVYGRLLWARGNYGHGGRLGYESEWRADKSIAGGGELVDQGSHLIDLCQFWFGPADLVFCENTSSYWQVEVEDNAFFALRPKSGGFAWMHASWTEWKNQFSIEITLERAKIALSGLGGSYGVETLTLYEMRPEMGPPLSTTTSWDSTDLSWSLEMKDFIAQIKEPTRFPLGATIESTVEVWQIIEKAYSK